MLQHPGGEVSAVDPVASMQAIDNSSLAEVAKKVQAKLPARPLTCLKAC